MKAPLLIAALGAATGTLLLAGTLGVLATLAPSAATPSGQAATRTVVAALASTGPAPLARAAGG